MYEITRKTKAKTKHRQKISNQSSTQRTRTIPLKTCDFFWSQRHNNNKNSLANSSAFSTTFYVYKYVPISYNDVPSLHQSETCSWSPLATCLQHDEYQYKNEYLYWNKHQYQYQNQHQCYNHKRFG